MSNPHDDSSFREAAKERLTIAQERLRFAEAEVTRLKRQIDALQEVIATLSSQPAAKSEMLFKDLPAGHRPFARMTIKEAAQMLLESVGQPMTVRELFEALQAGGKRVGGKKPTDTLRSLLRAYEDTFKKTPDAKWTIVNGSGEESKEEMLR